MAKTLLIIFIGVLFQLSAVWFVGVNRSDGLFFCCRGVPDDIYHLALTNQLVNQFPPQEPGMAGVVVKNYHYLASLVMADFIRVFHLPLMPTVYQYFPLFVSLLLGLTVVSLAQILNLNKKIVHLWLFFLYFHGDILYLLLWFRGKGMNFDVTIFDDATKLLAGPPRSFSILLLFTGLVFFLNWIKKKSFFSGVLAAVVLGSLIGFKIYTGLFALVGLAAIGVYFLVKNQWKNLTIPVLALIVSLAIYLPVNGPSGGLIFNGLYRFDNFISQPEFGLQNLELARLTGAWYLEILFFGAYVIFLYGTSLLAWLQTKKTLGVIPLEFNIFLILASVVTAIVGLFFLQNIGGLNTVQFLIALYFVGALYAALAAARFPRWVLALVILLTIPRPIYEVLGNIQMIKNQQGLTISNSELEALNFLKNQPTGVVALPPEFARQEISLYISFLTNQPIYLAGYAGVLEDHQVPGAKEKLEDPDFSEVDYFYLPKKYSFSPPGTVVFENQEVKILKILKF